MSSDGQIENCRRVIKDLENSLHEYDKIATEEISAHAGMLGRSFKWRKAL
jgi:hypothetical protein